MCVWEWGVFSDKLRRLSKQIKAKISKKYRRQVARGIMPKRELKKKKKKGKRTIKDERVGNTI